MTKVSAKASPRPSSNAAAPVVQNSKTAPAKTKKVDTAAKVIAALVPGHSQGVRPAPSTADRSGRRPLK